MKYCLGTKYTEDRVHTCSEHKEKRKRREKDGVGKLASYGLSVITVDGYSMRKMRRQKKNIEKKWQLVLYGININVCR